MEEMQTMHHNIPAERQQNMSVKAQDREDLLNNGLITADKFINKNYLIDLSRQEVVPLDESNKRNTPIRLFEIKKLVYDKQENINDKLVSVYSALQDVGSSALLIINGDGDKITFYIGVRNAGGADTAKRILEKSFQGNFPGSELRSLKNHEIEELMQTAIQSGLSNTSRNVSSVTVVPSMRDEDKDKFVQGIEKFIDTMQGEKYTAIFIAAPVDKDDLEVRKRGFEELYSALSPYIKTSLSYGQNYSNSVTNGMSENFSHTINNSVSNTTGGNSSKNSSTTTGTNRGSNFNVAGFGSNSGRNRSTTTGYTSGTSWSRAVTEGTADTTGSSTNRSDTQTNGDSRTFSVEHQNKSVADMLEKIDEQLKRLKACEAFGLWECCCYFIADDIQTSVVAANAYKALMLGDHTDVENSFVNVWGIQEGENTERVLEYMRYGMHPIVRIDPEKGYENQYVTPGNLISGKELPLLMGLPHKSVTGLTVSDIAEFGRNVFLQSGGENRRKIRLGKVYHMGKDEKTSVNLDLDSFTSHCFITGSTGSGKSNTTYGLLGRFIENDIPFLVIEPAKGEYKEAFGAVPGINIFTTNPLIGQMLKLNPFRFDPNIHILEHLDRLIEIFNACWEMYAAMPAILKDAVEQIYVDKGWDLLNSVYLPEGEPVYPSFKDLMRKLPQIIDSSAYSSDSKGDYTGALVTRVTSLTNGISGQIFCDSYDIPDNVMFDQNTIVDISRVGSTETKSLIMGILVLKLSEYRMANASEANSGLRHITVLEEAHNLLKRATPGDAASSVVGKSVEMICNSIAEMRTYGEGFIIVDQSPTSVDIAAIKNTNTKILMRLPEKGDCEAVGNSVGLNDDQIKELAKLSTGIAVVMQNNWLESVLTHVDAYKNKYEKKIEKATPESIRELRGAVAQELIRQYDEDQLDTDQMINVINSTSAPYYKKSEMRCCMEYTIERLKKHDDFDFLCQTLLNVTGTQDLFEVTASAIQEAEEGSDSKYDQESVEDWASDFYDGISRYVDLPDTGYTNTLCRLLLNAQFDAEGAIDYVEIDRLI